MLDRNDFLYVKKLLMNKAIILLRSRSFFGANIVNLPAIYIVKKYLKTDEITVFTDINVSGFYDQLPWVSRQSDVRGFYSVYKKTAPNTDFLYSMRPSMDSVCLLKPLRNIKVAVGLSLRSNLLNRFFDYHCPCSTSVYRAVSHILPLINYLLLPEPASYYLREAMLDLIESAPFSVEPIAAKNRICIMSGAGGGEHKKWGIENYWQLAMKLHQANPALHFDFIMGPDDEQEIEFLSLQKKSFSFATKQTLALKDLIGLVENSALTIANDCGPSHIAQCLVKPFIGLYYEPNPEWFLPHPLSCSLSPDNADIKSLSVDNVLAMSLRLLCNPPRS